MNRLLQFSGTAQTQALAFIERQLFPYSAVKIAGHGGLEVAAFQQYQRAFMRKVRGADGIQHRAFSRILTQLDARAAVPARQGFQGAQGQALAVEVRQGVQVQPFIGTGHPGFLGTPSGLRGQGLGQAARVAKGLQLICRRPLQHTLGDRCGQGRIGIQQTLYIGIGRRVQHLVALFQQRPLEGVNGIAEIMAQLARAHLQRFLGATWKLFEQRVDTLQGVQQLPEQTALGHGAFGHHHDALAGRRRCISCLPEHLALRADNFQRHVVGQQATALKQVKLQRRFGFRVHQWVAAFYLLDKGGELLVQLEALERVFQQQRQWLVMDRGLAQHVGVDAADTQRVGLLGKPQAFEQG